MKRFLAFIYLALATCLHAQTPVIPQQWWIMHGMVNPNKSADDYAICNRGQLKYMALGLKWQMAAYRMPGGPGAEIEQMVSGWLLDTTEADDYAAANLGQLKNTVYPFYQRLFQLGLITAMPAWLLPGSTESDPYQVINLGQLKNAFNIDVLQLLLTHGGYNMVPTAPVTGGPTTDTDSDGILNTDEIRFADTAGLSTNIPNTASNSQLILVDDASRFVGVFFYLHNSGGNSQGVSLDPENNVLLAQ